MRVGDIGCAIRDGGGRDSAGGRQDFNLQSIADGVALRRAKEYTHGLDPSCRFTGAALNASIKSSLKPKLMTTNVLKLPPVRPPKPHTTTLAQLALARLATSLTFLTPSPHATANILCVAGA